MKRSTSSVRQQPSLWLLFILRLGKCFKPRYLSTVCILFIILTCLRLISYTTSNQLILTKFKLIIKEEIMINNYALLNPCNSNEIKTLLQSTSSYNNNNNNDGRPQPTVERLHKLFQILISHENKYRTIFDYLDIFRFNDFYNTLRPFANNTERLQNIYCLFRQYINISDNGHIVIKQNFITYLKLVSNYLSDGFKKQHLTWNITSKDQIQKPVIILAADSLFYDTLQASMSTINNYLKDYIVAIYDLQLNMKHLNMIKENCERCIIIPFPFAQIAPIAPHVRNLRYFAWKPIVIQDAVRRFGTIIYGDTSIRYKTSNFDRLLIDNMIRGFSCRELPGQYLPCFTLSKTFLWFNETFSTFEDIYIAEAGFVAVTDNFLSRLILKTWVTCALDSMCIAPYAYRTYCKHANASTDIHRFDQSTLVTALSFYFFPSPRQNNKTKPAPYDMYTSIQENLADVKRNAGVKNYFTSRKNLNLQQNSSKTTVKIH
ncbi:unnamed protein product [Rotaria sordida]|uniref:Uncharacterized protein n=1 Tax=Rotaria sordida TaxID=392033 RepID=A0A819R4U5_9BILA|nr:unnamed protein product [Rotaria sordida]